MYSLKKPLLNKSTVRGVPPSEPKQKLAILPRYRIGVPPQSPPTSEFSDRQGINYNSTDISSVVISQAPTKESKKSVDLVDKKTLTDNKTSIFGNFFCCKQPLISDSDIRYKKEPVFFGGYDSEPGDTQRKRFVHALACRK